MSGPSHESPPGGPPRRGFLTAAAAVGAGAVALLTPLASGIAVFLAPLWKKAKSPSVPVALLEQVPDDGVPRAFTVLADKVDHWNGYSNQRLGAVYLVRKPGEEKPLALSAKCPHAGCFIGYTPGDELFMCPCHTSSFDLDGARSRGDQEVSPRDMDPLPVELKPVEGSEDGALQVWVEYIDYQTGHAERIAGA